MATRSELREKIMIILYQYDLFLTNKIDCNIDEIIKENVQVNNDFVNDLVNGIIKEKEQIDNLANKYMLDWTIDRLEKTGASILRLGLYELKYTDTPHKVVINEAILLAKKYSDDKVKNIINAVLDKVSKEVSDAR